MTQTLFRGAALADGRSPNLQKSMSVLVADRRIAWIRPEDDEEELGSKSEVEIVDASGATIVPGLVDSHAHVTLPGGAHWTDRIGDPTDRLLAVAEDNGELMYSAGIRWARDVGGPLRDVEGRRRALSIVVRDKWQGSPRRPHMRTAGSWIGPGLLLEDDAERASDGDELLAAAVRQMDDGADLVKLWAESADESIPWDSEAMAAVVAAAHARGMKVTAHATRLPIVRECVAAGVDCIEHGTQLDADIAAEMARGSISLVSTLSVYASLLTFSATTEIPRFAQKEDLAKRFEQAKESVRLAHKAGVSIAAGSDFGGGSTRANQLAWEVENLVSAGLEPWEALGAATWRGGELLGEPDAGVLREGRPTDLILVHGDPLSDPASLWRVWRVSW